MLLKVRAIMAWTRGSIALPPILASGPPRVAAPCQSRRVVPFPWSTTAESAAVAFANRHRGDFGDFYKKQRRGAYPPKVEFFIDLGEKNRQRMDELSS